ncbi:MAG: glycosyltransferase family 4 protein [Bacillota bacterium]|nr:glycosyltransferase family 4 protein [Bacillota bacterium]
MKVRKNILKMSKIFAVSQRVKEAVGRVYYNDITITQNAPFRPEKHIDSIKTEILFIGRLNESKGIKNVIKMLQILDLKNAHFTIHGGAEFDSEYQDKIKELSDASDSIDLISEPLPRSEIIQLFKKADIFYFPSRLEGGPLVVLEALSAGCAVVTTPVGMVPQIIKEGFNGFICEFDDIEKQKQILQNLINDRSLLNKIKGNTLKTILPTWDETAGIMYGEYKELMRR